MTKAPWVVTEAVLRDSNGALLGIARHDGKWRAQEFRDGVEWIKSGQSKVQSLKGAKRDCEKFLKANRAEREETLTMRQLHRP